MVRQTSKCLICELRPAKDGALCANCYGRLEAERKRRTPEKPELYLTCRGDVVGLYHNGGDTLKARLLKVAVERLPKKRTVNLDTYCEGYSREQIKRFKACVLKLARV